MIKTAVGIIVAFVAIGFISLGLKGCGDSEEEVAETESFTEVSGRTEEGHIVYDMSLDVSMKKGEKRTFNVPFGTKIRRHNTTGQVTKHSTQGKEYTLEALEDVTFDLVWFIEKGFENKVKPL